MSFHRIRSALSRLKHLAVMSGRFFFLTCAKDSTTCTNAGPTLVIAPHPDDETIGCAATMAQLSKNGHEVRIVVVTDGRFSSKSSVVSPDKLASIRQEEARSAAAIIGIEEKNVFFLGIPDGNAKFNGPKIAAALTRHINEFSPKQIFAPYSLDSHPDHREASRTIRYLLAKGIVTCPVYEYPLWFWPWGAIGLLVSPRRMANLRRVDIKNWIDLKKSAITAHKSQCSNLTGEKEWSFLPEMFLKRFLMPYELFLKIDAPKQ